MSQPLCPQITMSPDGDGTMRPLVHKRSILSSRPHTFLYIFFLIFFFSSQNSEVWNSHMFSKRCTCNNKTIKLDDNVPFWYFTQLLSSADLLKLMSGFIFFPLLMFCHWLFVYSCLLNYFSLWINFKKIRTLSKFCLYKSKTWIWLSRLIVSSKFMFSSDIINLERKLCPWIADRFDELFTF